MKQKLFTLLTLLCFAVSGAWADGKVVKLFHWQTDATAPTLSTAMTASHGGAPSVGSAVWEGEEAPGTESATYNSAVTDTDLKGSTGSKALKIGKTKLSLKITLLGDVKLQAGDVISVCGYKPFNIGSTEDSDHKAGTEIASALATGTAKGDYNVGTITVTADMITTIGSNVNALYFSRAEGSGTGLAAIKITRTITAPLITTQPISADYAVGESATALTVAAIASTGDLSYQWYKNTDGDTSAKVEDKIVGATSATLAAAEISTAAAGTFYYYCVVGDGSANKTTSSKATITVTQTYTVTYKANGSGEDDVIDNDATTVAANPFTYDDHVFTGWNTDAGGGGTAYAVGDAVTGNLTLFAQWAATYTITKGSHTNGDFSIDKTSAAAGETVTLTATPDFKYVLDSWSVYKTGEPGTTVTVTSNQFTMPAYAVTVDATFAADAKKQVLYVTSDGTVNASDKLYEALSEDYTLTKAAYNASKTVTDFDLVVLHESIGGTNYNTGLVKAAKEADVPVLNTKVYFYSDGRWGWGTPNAGSSVTGATLNNKYSNIASHPIFEDVTVSEGAFTMFSSAQAKAMQPVELSADGYGYVLATTPAKSPDTGTTCIHEMTAAQRGLTGGATSKYLMISIGNENGCFELLTANGKKLLKNAAAYLMSDDNWTPADEAISTASGKTYATYVTTNALDFSSVSDDIKAYVAASEAAGTKITFTGKDAVPAGTPILVKTTTPGATVNVPVASSAPAAVGTNKLVAGTGVAISYDAGESQFYYILTNGQFKPANNSVVAVGKAYLSLDNAVSAQELTISFDDEEGDVTGIKNLTTTTSKSKGVAYNLAGQRVNASHKGIVIVNGKKYLNK